VKKNRHFIISPSIRRPREGGSRRNIATPFGMEKVEWWGYPTVKKIEDIYNGLDTIPACDRQTDRHLATAYTRYAYASRSKNRSTFAKLIAKIKVAPFFETQLHSRNTGNTTSTYC